MADTGNSQFSHKTIRTRILRWLGPKIRNRMDELNISISMLSRMTGIGVSTISDYLTGRYEPSLSKIMSLSNALKVDYSFFFEDNFLVRGGIITDGLISYWSLDRADMDGKTVRDIWGNSDGKIIGNPSIVKGRFGEALEFTGDENCIQFDDSAMPADNAPRTLSAWILMEEIPVVYNFSSIIEWGTNANHQRCGMLITFRQNVYFVGEHTDLNSVGTIELNTWNHVAITYDSEIARIYINGDLDAEGAPGWSGQALVLKTKLCIGRMGLNVRDEESFPGIIDEVSIYNRALSEDEIKQNFAAKGE